MSDDDNDALSSNVAVLLNGVGAAAIVATIYHCPVMTWCCRYRARPNPQEPQLYVNENFCLGDFEGGEQLRELPERLHSYHVACIDMWLYSHSSCPMCRTDATHSQQVFLNARDLDSERSSEPYRSEGVLRGIVVHPRAM
ncbi:hypothetical protein NC652_020524 [Populus alba x Populus x berolinensis]|nr:hypothetical protein NC652_020524 [Populus alba x Populus x berolinensis]